MGLLWGCIQMGLRWGGTALGLHLNGMTTHPNFSLPTPSTVTQGPDMQSKGPPTAICTIELTMAVTKRELLEVESIFKPSFCLPLSTVYYKLSTPSDIGRPTGRI